MPEFEEPDSQPNPDHNYTPSSNAQKKTGGRRRSGGFKSDAVPSNSAIGEVDPSEALKLEVEKSQPIFETTAEAPENDPTPEATDPIANTPKEPRRSWAASKQPQPSEATLQSIQSVEEKIARRRAEIEKKRPPRDSRERTSRKRRSGSTQKNTSVGLLRAIKGLFGKLFGKGSESSSADARSHPSGRKYSRNNNRRYRGETPRNTQTDSRPKRHRGSRGRRSGNAHRKNEKSSY